MPRITEAKQHADLVIVFAHWGKEYDNDPYSTQPPLAKAWIDAGAGLILGSHPHVPGAIEEIDGSVVFYSLGNFIFDQTFWTATMESALPEMTFQGNRLVQIRLHPFVAPDVQPNFLDPATDDGKAVMHDHPGGFAGRSAWTGSRAAASSSVRSSTPAKRSVLGDADRRRVRDAAG